MSWYMNVLCKIFAGVSAGIYVASLVLLWEMIGAYWVLNIGIDPIEHNSGLAGPLYMLGWIYAFGWAIGVACLAIIAHVKGLKIKR
jgi:hypothetical protein